MCAPSNVAVDKVMSEVIKLFGKDQEMKSGENWNKSSVHERFIAILGSSVRFFVEDMIADAETMEDAITAHENYPKLCDIYDNMVSSLPRFLLLMWSMLIFHISYQALDTLASHSLHFLVTKLLIPT